MKEILNYFPYLTSVQVQQLQKLENIYREWNYKINLISRKDIDNLYLKHILHSLAIAKIQPFEKSAYILDVGTGGGFPGIPLAILFPETNFYLIDIILKKITVIQAIVEAIDLKNVKAEKLAAQQVKGEYDFVISRAVTNFPVFVSWVKNLISKNNNHRLKNGILYLKGGNLMSELKDFSYAEEYCIANYFYEPFFETKKVVYLPL